MLLGTHLDFSANKYQAQNMTWHRGTLPAAWQGGQFFDNTATSFYLSRDGSTWKKVLLQGDLLASDIPLTNGYLLRGNGSNVAEAILPSSIALSAFGAPTTTIDLGGTHTIIGVPTPGALSVGSTIVNKEYVDNLVQGISAKNACRVATTAEISGTWSTTNGGTITGTFSPLSVDGVTLATGDRVLVKDQSTQSRNGIYVYDAGDGFSIAWTLVRSADANTADELESAYTFIAEGSTNAGKSYVQQTDNFVLNTGNVVWVQFSGSGTYTGGNGISVSGSTISLLIGGTTTWSAGIVPYAGTANTLTGAAHPGGSGFPFVSFLGNTWGAGSYKLVEGLLTANAIQFASSTTQIGQIAPAANSILVTNGSSVPSLGTDIPTAVTIGGQYVYRVGGTDVGVSDGGTGASLSPAAGGLVYGASASALAVTGAFTSGHFIRSGGSGAPTAYDLFGSNNTWTGTQTINSTSASALAVSAYFQRAASNGTSEGPRLCAAASSYDGTFHRNEIRLFAQTTNNAGTNALFKFVKSYDSGAESDLFHIQTSSASNAFIFYNFASFSLVNPGGGRTTTFTQDTGDGVHELTLPSADGTLALTTNTTFGSGSTWQGNLIGVAYGGTGANLSGASVGSLVTIGSGPVFSTLAAHATANRILLNGGTGTPPSWSGYAMPSGALSGNRLLYSSTTTQVSELAPTNNRLLRTNGSGVPVFDVVVNNPTSGSIEMTRKFSANVEGTGVSYIDVTHNLGTINVLWSVRVSNATNTATTPEFVFTKVTVQDSNTLRVHFGANVSAGTYYHVVVLG